MIRETWIHETYSWLDRRIGKEFGLTQVGNQRV